ncbi:exosome complex component rrp46 [Anaeramoeba ignava]|uniref:Exosome complex component rrp46 n=1 Tax=Anaeramoeba ignava TaxID=1746090 RepID=A0A9Q0LFG7_ANAIG|nr:exosome complex component rrp46 [Anaeramoeba ignava]
MQRLDSERTANQLRSFETEFDIIKSADGSVKYSQGKTTVIVGVYGPIEVKQKKEKAGTSFIEVSVTSEDGIQHERDIEYAIFIRNTLENVIHTKMHPLTSITVAIQIVSDDGSLFATIINAVCLSLLICGIEMKCLFSATNFLIEKKNNEINKKIFIDPLKREEENQIRKQNDNILDSSQKALVTIVVDNVSFASLAIFTDGLIDENVLFRCIELSKMSGKTIFNFIKLALQKKLEKN